MSSAVFKQSWSLLQKYVLSVESVIEIEIIMFVVYKKK